MQTSTRLCEHIKRDGIRCGSPALRPRPYCYFHNRMLTGQAVRHDIPARELPPLTSHRNIAIAMSTVLRNWHSGRFTRAEAASMINAIQFSKNLLGLIKERDRQK